MAGLSQLPRRAGNGGTRQAESIDSMLSDNISIFATLCDVQNTAMSLLRTLLYSVDFQRTSVKQAKERFNGSLSPSLGTRFGPDTFYGPDMIHPVAIACEQLEASKPDRLRVSNDECLNERSHDTQGPS